MRSQGKIEKLLNDNEGWSQFSKENETKKVVPQEERGDDLPTPPGLCSLLGDHHFQSLVPRKIVTNPEAEVETKGY